MTVHAPLSGIAIPLSLVPDPVFARGIVGPGAAIVPREQEQAVLAPISGRLLKLKPHAFVVQASDGRSVLVHLGIDTVQLDDAGAFYLTAEGQEVASGTVIARWNPAVVIAAGLSPLCPVIALDVPAGAITGVVNGPVTAGEELFAWK